PDEIHAARHSHREQHLLRWEAEHDAAAHRLESLGWNVLLLDDAAPGDVVGEPRLHVGEKLPAHGGVHAIRADDEIRRVAAAVGEDGGGSLHALEHHR